MSSIVLGKSDAYINIGTARAWREHLLNHTFSAWIKTTCQQPACLVSLTNDVHEVYSVEINVTPHPSRDATQIAHKYQHVPPTRFLNSAGTRWQRAPVPKSLRPVKIAGTQGALLGNLAGGVRISVRDDDGNCVVAESPLPVLADGRWHFLQVTVDGSEIMVQVDANRTSVVYRRRDTALHPVDWQNVGERVVYPSHDLIAARFSTKDSLVHDHYCGLLADVAVEIGHPGGHRLHWWVTDFSKGTIVWDRGSGAKQHPLGLHLNLCSCSWETEDFPATSLMLNGVEGRIAEVPALTEKLLEELTTVGTTSVQSGQDDSTPAALSSLTPPLSYQSDANPGNLGTGGGSPSPAGNSLTSPASLLTPSSGKGNHVTPGGGDEQQGPVSQTMNREYFERVKREEGRQAVSFAMWICTRDRDPALVFTAPFLSPVHMILNLDCKPSVALVNGVDAFVSQCDVTDGKWHHIRWIIDPKTGASLFLDGALAAWQYVALQVDEDGGPVRGKANSLSSEATMSPVDFGSQVSMVSRSRTRYQQQSSETFSSQRLELEQALRRRSVETSKLNFHSERKSLTEKPLELEAEEDASHGGGNRNGGASETSGPAAHTAQSWRRARARNSITFLEAESLNGSGDTCGGGSTQASFRQSTSGAVQGAAQSSGFAMDEDELFGKFLQDLEDADERVASAVASGHDPLTVTTEADSFSQSNSSATKSSSTAKAPVVAPQLDATVSHHFLFLSIKKRREIIRILTEMVLNRAAVKGGQQESRASFTSAENEAIFKCFTMGHLFAGELREVVVKLGMYSFTWRFDAGAGRSVDPEVRFLSTEGGAEGRSRLNSFALPTPCNDARCGIGGGFDNSGTDELAVRCPMSLSGRTTVFPKTVLPYSTPILDDSVCLDLGAVRVPTVPTSTGVDMDFYVRLGKHQRAYGHVVIVEGVCIVELQSNRINVFLVSALTPSLSASTLLHHPGFDQSILSDTTSPRVVCCSQDTSMFEDHHWHHVRLIIPTIGSCEGVTITLDEIPTELSTSLVREQFPRNGESISIHNGDAKNGRTMSTSSRRGTLLQKQAAPTQRALSNPDPITFAFVTGSEDQLVTPPMTFGTQAPSTPTPTDKLRVSNGVKDIFGKVRHLLTMPRTADTAIASAQAAHDVLLAPVTCGGNGFCGSVCQLRLLVNGIEHRWPLDDASRTKLGRMPPVLDERFQTHNKMAVDPNSIAALVPAKPSQMQCEVAGDEHRHWQNTMLPSRALHFDGHSSFVSSVNLKSNFHMSNLKHFALSLWIKAGSSTDPTIAVTPGCVASVHDIQKHSTESSCGIFTHTRVDPHTSPRKRELAPYITTFLLVDSCARALCIETTYDIYDGLWHKLQWVVYDAEVNESHVFIDDIAVPIRVVCGDQPREFTCRNPVLNLGARNEGDNDVNYYFVGEIRNFRFSRDVGDEILSWPMTEGDGEVLNDEYQRVAGCTWAPEWVFTPFPPMTPILRDESIIEFSPVSDLEGSALQRPIWFSFALKSNSTAIGSVWSIVSADRCVIGSLIANEGGDHERRFNEPGTHILRIKRVVRKQVPILNHLSTSAGAAASYRDGVASGATTMLAAATSPPVAALGMLVSPSSRAATAVGDDMMSTSLLQPSDMNEDELRSFTSTSAKTPHQRRRRIARRAELKQLLDQQQEALDGSSHNADAPSEAAAVEMRMATILEERAYQFHYKELCDGKWHNVTIRLPPDPTSEAAVVYVDELDMQAMHLHTTNLRELQDGIVETLAAMPATNASRVQERTPMEVLRDEICWASVVLGKSAVGSAPALHCCVRNFAVLTSTLPHGPRTELLFVPLASNTDMLVSHMPRDVAATGLTWELSVPPKSSIALGNDSYVLVPPLPKLNLRSFEITFQLRAVTTEASCVVEFGSVEKGYFCIMLNQDAFGETTPNSIRVCLCDTDRRELHASCFLSEEEFDPIARAKSVRPIDDDRWHSITLRVVDSSRNHVLFEVDGTVPQIRYANCGSPEHFLPLSEGGTIGALLDGLDPQYSLNGSVKNFCVCSLTNGVELSMDPSLEIERERLVFYEGTSGFASILTDRSGNRNHAMAVKPNWKTDIQTAWPPFEVPSKASDVFGSSFLSVTRWSNNPSDEIEKNTASDEVVMDEFPFDGWSAGSKGPQWISIDLGTTHTVFGIEVDVVRASTSTHEVYVSRSNLSRSATFHNNADPLHNPVPQATLLEVVHLRPSSPKTIRIKVSHPLHGIRWIRIKTAESAGPAGYSSIRVIGMRGDQSSTRKYSVSEVLGRTLSTLSANSQSGPMLSTFPDTFVPDREVPPQMVTKQSAAAALKKQRGEVQWGGEDQDGASAFSAAFSGSNTAIAAGRANRPSRVQFDTPARDASPALNRTQSTIDAENVQNERMQLLRKTSQERIKELKLIFYTQDVERAGIISLAAFMVVFKKLDVTGLLSEEQVLSLLRDAGVLDSNVSFEQFVKVISHLETW